jgi:thiamine-phosphate pyrophosphorylase
MATEFNLHGIYAITDSALMTDGLLLPAVEQTLRGGAHMLQYRNKIATPAERTAQAQALLELCNRYRVPLIINDDIELAAASGAAGVHLGRNDASLPQARRRLGTAAIIGVSCYNQLPRALEAQAAGANYVAFGSVYPSPTKPDAVRVPLQLFTQAKQSLHIPVCAIGGIRHDNAAPLLESGVDLLAVISAIFAQKDIESATRRLVECWDLKKTMTPRRRDAEI